MNEKKMKLIEAGVRLVATQGYHNTSIQEIASEAGVSKGAFYLYFQSKEEFIETAYRFFHTEITQRFNRVKQENHSPREILEKQLTILIDYIYHYKEFIIMHLRENISVGQHTDKLMRQMKMENFHWLSESIQNIYADKVEELIVDAVIQFEGLINGYFKWIVIDNIHIERDKLSAFLIRRLDDIVHGMLTAKEEALTTIGRIPREYLTENKTSEQMISNSLIKLSEKIKKLDENPAKIKQLQEVVDAIEKEADKNKTRPVVIQGLLAHFRGFKEMQDECEQLASVLQVELLH
ncbi:TetR/AcrR family transcriptional regulator [Virgibacillus sp. NKC19-16]|uniref:TetR/AcrR family transcriptional regulator n=1 Tax=Virgibacillus salidurans TaxID=2831673 RepID=UPI001F20BBD0|nr:TetR/AcrR family transcriptional regulator [Virgibacillus sp. NKC19-16]UJL45954.1 TetR/AcrR family transcriptional regulator [Virgibacillus sp. NKC19-16]